MKKFAIIFTISLLELNDFSSNIFIRVFPLILTFWLILHNRFLLNAKISEFKTPKIIFALLILLFIGVVRNGNPYVAISYNIYKLFNIILLIIAFLQTLNLNLRKDPKDLYFISLYFPLLMLVLINFFTFLLFREPTKAASIGGAIMLSKLGINASRVSFPFSPGNNAYSTIVGYVLVMSIFSFIFKIKRYYFISFIGIIFSVITLLLSDTRSAFIYPFIIFIPLFFIVKNWVKPRFINLLPLLIIVGPLLLLFAMSIIAKIPELQFLQRSDNDFQTGNARLVIWSFSLIEFLHFKLIHLIGYGEFGQYISGASANWAFMFGAWDYPTLTTSHSILFTILFDYGYLGLGFIIYYQFKLISIIKMNWEKYKLQSIIILSFLVYWNLLGLTEAFFGFYGNNTMPLFLIISIYAFFVDFFAKQSNIVLNKIDI